MTLLIADLCLSKNNHVTRVQSSVKETNQRDPKMFGIVEGPHIPL